MSTTKLLTLITAFKYIKNIQQVVTFIEDDLIGTENTSGCYFHPEDTISINELIYAMLLPSSNQAANIIARVAGEIITNKMDD